MEDLYTAKTPIADKWLKPDGTIATHDGTTIYLPADAARADAYVAARPIPNKYLKSDGSIVSISGITRIIISPADITRASQWKAARLKAAKWLNPNGDLIDELGNSVGSLGDEGRILYESKACYPDKFLNQDGSISQMDGTIVTEASQTMVDLYDSAAPIVDKWIDSSGEIIEIICTSGDIEIIGNPIVVPKTVKSLILKGETVQDGSGAPSPSNIRKINYNRLITFNCRNASNYNYNQTNTIQFSTAYSAVKTVPNKYALCTHFKTESNILDREHFYIFGGNSGGYGFHINKSRLSPYGFISGTPSTYISSFNAWKEAQAAAGTPVRIGLQMSFSSNVESNCQMFIQKSGDVSPDTPRSLIELGVSASPLFGQNDFFDQMNDDGTILNNFKYLAFDGTENWMWTTSNGGRFTLALADLAMSYGNANTDINLVCSHYNPDLSLDTGSVNSNVINIWGSPNTSPRGILTLRDTRFTNDVAGFKAYIAAQNSAGTPIQIVYERASATTSTVSPLDLTQIAVGDMLVGSGDMIVTVGS